MSTRLCAAAEPAISRFLALVVFFSGTSLFAQETSPVAGTISPMGVNVKDYGASGSDVQTAGKIGGGGTLLEVADASSFKPGQGIYLWLDSPEDGIGLAEAGAADFTLECDVVPNNPGYTDTHGGVAFRVKDDRNFWIVYFAGFPACGYQVSLKKMVDGRLQDAGPMIGHQTGLSSSFHLKVVCAGPAISAFVNEKQLGQTIQDSFCAERTQVGFFRHAKHSAPIPTTNPSYAGGGTICYRRFSAGKFRDDFDRCNLWKTMGPAWKPIRGTWGIYEKSAFPVLANKGIGLSTEVTAIEGNKIRLRDRCPEKMGKDVDVSVYHDDTAAIYRASMKLRQVPGELSKWARTGNLLFPDGTYCISKPIYGNVAFGLVGVPSNTYTFSHIKGAWLRSRS
jgi:hypothetical protein